MATTLAELPLIVVVGPTASGKSDVAVHIAESFDGEIICADSRTIYKYMNIGTAKPSAEDQAKVPHWGLDIAEPGTVFTAADFQSYATNAIADIRSRGKIPVMVGGSGLYIDGVIFDYKFGLPQPKQRELLEALSLDELKEYCANNNIELPENNKNRRYVIRAVEQKNINTTRVSEPIANTLVVGITTYRQELRSRIESRIEHMFDRGVVDEAKMLGKKYGWDSEAMTGNIYRQIRLFLDGEIDEVELKRRCVVADYRLAKRQQTWFKRNPYIHWKPADEVFDFVANALRTIS